MEEIPNLEYIDQLSNGDASFKSKILGVMKDEMAEEIGVYEHEMEKEDYRKASEAVHKLKHKVGILGMEKSYLLTEQYEDELREGNLSLCLEFGQILEKILIFSKNL